jgi:hypothetical protein
LPAMKLRGSRRSTCSSAAAPALPAWLLRRRETGFNAPYRMAARAAACDCQDMLFSKTDARMVRAQPSPALWDEPDAQCSATTGSSSSGC